MAIRISSVVDWRRADELGDGSRELPVLEPSGDLPDRRLAAVSPIGSGGIDGT